ncbi:alpha/beta hydrolase [Pseudohalioglobus lutimaris]|uniref:alpha/beta hydrolase n=1 Tax=Pseudohalioglobus lutimaris TaxID=1737061 RepID=UPI00105491E1|nr:alpha/beta hydrolase [Pseudohalioglobus lutimaris]
MSVTTVTAQELDELRGALPAFGDNGPSALFLRYLGFYDLNFNETYPEATYRFGSIVSGNFRLMTHCWTVPDARANLCLVHGYFDHSGLYDKLVAYGLSRRCNVLIFDLPGHGLSSGEPGVIDSFTDYADAVVDVLDGVELPHLPLHAMGQSTGCAALMECARSGRWRFQHAIFLAPLVRPAGWVRVRVGFLLLHRFRDSVTRSYNRNSSDDEFLEFVRRDPLQCRRVSLRWLGALKRWLAALPLTDFGVGPVQVIQGQRDTTVQWRYNMGAISKLFPGSTIDYLPEAGHQLANESLAIRERYFPIMDRYLFR